MSSGSQIVRAFLAGSAGVAIAIAAAVVSAIGLAVADLYLSGHGLASIRAPLVDNVALSLSLADVLFLLITGIAGFGGAWGVWRAVKR